MKYVMINPSNLSGKVEVPTSKSACHRAVICAGLSNGTSNISNVVFSEDVEATCDVMKNLGVRIKKEKNSLQIRGLEKLEPINSNMDCSESGSTLRFLIPVGATTGEKLTFKGKGKLIERPLRCYYNIFDEQKLKYDNANGKLPLTIEGKLKPDEYKVRGDISSQFISGLMFALPLLDGDSKIIITTELESKPYVDLTMDMLKKYGIDIENREYKEFIIRGNQSYKSSDCEVEGDFSQAAFWLAAGLLGNDIVCEGLDINSLQGDKAILNIIKSMNGKISIEGNKIKAVPSKTKGTIIDASQCPDLVPILTSLAALSEGTTEIVNAARLRIKESDRLSAISTELNRLGADIQEKEDGLIIRGKESLKGGEVQSWNDHRIAMALAVASIKCSEPVIIKDASCVKKSYPDFWKHFRALGGNIDEWSLGQ